MTTRTAEDFETLWQFIADRCSDTGVSARIARTVMADRETGITTSGVPELREPLEDYLHEVSPARTTSQVTALEGLARHVAVYGAAAAARDDSTESEHAYLCLTETARLWSGHAGFRPQWAGAEQTAGSTA